MLVCFDTNILIWGVREKSTAGQEHMIALAKEYIRGLSEIKARILLPTTVVAEYLIPCDDDSRQKQLAILEDHIIAPFDVPAATLAAAIQSRRDLIDRIRKDHIASRIAIKADCQIIAIAKTVGSDMIVSHDEALRKLAKDYITAVDLEEAIDLLKRDKQQISCSKPFRAIDLNH
jgi:predicted nucleic acid-binding protein